MSDKPEKWPTAADVNAALATRFAPQEWATIFDVGNATGFAHNRRADAISLNLWPSRGMEMHGFEVKVHRGDWLCEKDDPEKSAPIQKFCDRWWLVVGHESVIQDGELPATWGLLVMKGRKLVQKVEAPKLAPEPWPRPFVAAMLRCATKGVVPRSAVESLTEERYEARRQQDRNHVEIHHERMKKEWDEMRARVHAFEEASGLSISSGHEWRAKLCDPKLVGEAVKFVLARGLDTEHLQGMLNLLDRTREELVAAMAVAKSLPTIGEADEATT